MTEFHSDPLVHEAQQILLENDRGNYTVPNHKLFPHQWLWDSCFIAIGMSNYNPDRAAIELETLMSGQWANGMVAQCIFSDGIGHALERRNWDSRRNPNAPKMATTGITQPAMIAEAVHVVGPKLTPEKRHNFYQQMLPKLVDYHDFLMTERDINNDGLTTLIHPYESGMDNSPPWEETVREQHQTLYKLLGTPILKSLTHGAINLVRRDTKSVESGQRMHHADVLAYHALVGRIRRADYDIDRIVADSKIVLIEDVCFNSVLTRANSIVQEIANEIGYELTPEWLEKSNKQKQALDKLWEPKSGYYLSRNARTKELINIPTIASLMPLYSQGISQERANILAGHMQDQTKFATPYPVPSVPLDSNHLDLGRYWRGPAWLWMNWDLSEGLDSYGFKSIADNIRNSSLEAVKSNGMSEHMHTITGKGLGVPRFAPAAAIAIDFAFRQTLANPA